ncbi:hypothetical protein ALC60_00132 [Trachymyrmex zeteki]|uniref:Uncharacterized protein n=1 Tax=Mycetomoellerius zeteki TaxID=64791 RepID=A0A151XKH3_9HYME|nr:hypothetical protein ALC60_00132 [Trachymyrmex zeteki]
MFSRRFLPSSSFSQLCRDGPGTAIRSSPRDRQFNLAWAEIAMTNAARKCFIARQSRLTPTFVSTAVFCTPGNECSLQRDRRPRPLEILSSSAVNREVGSFASSEVNRALKAATTFSPSTEGCCFLYPSLPCLHRVPRCGQEVRALRSKKVTKRRDTMPLPAFYGAYNMVVFSIFLSRQARVNHISKRTDDIKTDCNLVKHCVISCLISDPAGRKLQSSRPSELVLRSKTCVLPPFLIYSHLLSRSISFTILYSISNEGEKKNHAPLDGGGGGGGLLFAWKLSRPLAGRNYNNYFDILQFVIFLLIQDSMSPDETPFRESRIENSRAILFSQELLAKIWDRVIYSGCDKISIDNFCYAFIALTEILSHLE